MGVLALAGRSCKTIAAGDRHALALVEGGKVFSWGSCRDGQLGHGVYATKNKPTEIEGLENMQHIAAAGNVSWAWRTLQAKGPEKKKREAPVAAAAEDVAEPAAKKSKEGPCQEEEEVNSP